MGVPSISENSTPAAHGDVGDYAFNWSLQSSIGRAGAIACSKTGGNPEDIVLFGESGAGEIIGAIRSTSKDPTLTDYLPADSAGVCGVNVVQQPARTNLIVAANADSITYGDYLIPTGAVGAVIPRPAGSNVPAVARALQSVPSSANERYVYAEMLAPNPAAGLGQEILGEGTDTLTATYYVARSGAHVNPAAAKNTPILYRARRAMTIKNFKVTLEIAAGGSKVVTYEFKKGADAAAANAAAASVSVAITDPAKTNNDDSSTISLAAGEVLVCKITSADVGSAEHSYVQFRAVPA